MLDVLFGVGFVGYAAVGALIAARHPRNAVGWLFCGVGVAARRPPACSTPTRRTASSTDGLPGDELAAWVFAWSGDSLLILIVLLLLLFPTGRFLSRAGRASGRPRRRSPRSRRWSRRSTRARSTTSRRVANPLGVDAAAGVLDALGVLREVFLVAFVVAAVSLLARFRARAEPSSASRSSGWPPRWRSRRSWCSRWPCSRRRSRPTRAGGGCDERGRAAGAGADPGRRRHRDAPPPALRRRRRHPPHADLRRADGDAGGRLPRLRAAGPGGHRGGVELRDRALDAGDGRALPAGARAHPGARRPALLPPPLRRGAARSRPSAAGCATSSTSTRSAPTCAPSRARRCNPPTSRCGCGGAPR